ncbi:unnamed protein product, partial [Ectocarpus sp. 12 AP-2014]
PSTFLKLSPALQPMEKKAIFFFLTTKTIARCPLYSSFVWRLRLFWNSCRCSADPQLLTDSSQSVVPKLHCSRTPMVFIYFLDRDSAAKSGQRPRDDIKMVTLPGFFPRANCAAANYSRLERPLVSFLGDLCRPVASDMMPIQNSRLVH